MRIYPTMELQNGRCVTLDKGRLGQRYDLACKPGRNSAKLVRKRVPNGCI